MNREVFKYVFDLAYQATDRICEDLTQEEVEKFKSLKILRVNENGKIFLDKVLYQSDLVLIAQGQFLGTAWGCDDEF